LYPPSFAVFFVYRKLPRTSLFFEEVLVGFLQISASTDWELDLPKTESFQQRGLL
jgi:hypothetical protein